MYKFVKSSKCKGFGADMSNCLADTPVFGDSTDFAIPYPMDKYYRIASDKEVDEIFGYFDEYDAYPSEDLDGYDVIHLAWAIGKDEYIDALGNDGIDCVELVREGTDDFLAFTAGDRLYRVDESDVERCLGLDY